MNSIISRCSNRRKKGGWEAQVRVQNVLDQRVTTGTGNAGTSPRRFSASIERRF